MSALSWDTPSMAELYLRQGHPEQAIETYARYLKVHPDDRKATLRMQALERGLRNGTLNEGPMDFRTQLKNLVESVQGAESAMLMGFDGIAIDSYELGASEVDLPTLLIEYSNSAFQLRHLDQSQPSIGQLQELTIQRSGGTCILKPVTEEYFVAMMLKPEAIVTKARFYLSMALPALRSALD